MSQCDISAETAQFKLKKLKSDSLSTLTLIEKINDLNQTFINLKIMKSNE